MSFYKDLPDRIRASIATVTPGPQITWEGIALAEGILAEEDTTSILPYIFFEHPGDAMTFVETLAHSPGEGPDLAIRFMTMPGIRENLVTRGLGERAYKVNTALFRYLQLEALTKPVIEQSPEWRTLATALGYSVPDIKINGARHGTPAGSDIQNIYSMVTPEGQVSPEGIALANNIVADKTATYKFFSSPHKALNFLKALAQTPGKGPDLVTQFVAMLLPSRAASFLMRVENAGDHIRQISALAQTTNAAQEQQGVEPAPGIK